LNFVEQTDEILAACTHPELRKGMFSATMPSSVEEMAKSVMSGGGIGAIRVIVGHK
jgi:ATP-dependent RNA helicase DDX52/ROK1